MEEKNGKMSANNEKVAKYNESTPDNNENILKNNKNTPGNNENTPENMNLPHYRLAIIGVTLEDTLEELIEVKRFDEAYRELVMETYDKTICKTLSEKVETSAKLQGTIIYYRSQYNIWSIFVENLEMIIDKKVLPMEGTTLITSIGKNR